MNKLIKTLSVCIAIVLLFFRILYPVVSLAQEVTDTPTPTPDNSATVTPTPTDDPSPTPDDPSNLDASSSADVNNNSNNLGDSGDNAIIPCVSPTPTPSIDPSITPDPDAAITPTSTPTSAPCPSPTPGHTTIDTGDATSGVSVTNNENVTTVNSSDNTESQDVTGTQSGDVNLGNTSPDLASNTSPTSSADSPSDLNVDNSATLNNSVVSIALTGANDASGSGTILTGDAYSVVSVINNVNLTLVNSAIQILTLNIYGVIDGNIILPDLPESSCNCGDGTTQNITNNATVNNNVNSEAVSGQNTIQGGSGYIMTGDATSIVNLLNLVNSIFASTNVQALFINVFGQWNGDFLGWGDISSANGGTTLMFLNTNATEGGINCGCSTNSNIDNNALVNNDVTSIADTGNNTITGGGKDKIITGNAYSSVSVVNMVNTTFIDSNGIFAFINIFGILNGDIGSFSNVYSQNSQDSNASQDNQNDNSNQDSGGGMFSVTNQNNVGKFVLPGDTVTFTVDVKNTGSGKIHDGKVDLFLIRGGNNVGGGEFSIGDIDPGHSKTLITGLVMGKNAHLGQYTADANVQGTSGGLSLSQEAFSTFLVSNGGYFVTGSGHGQSSLVLADSKVNNGKNPAAANSNSKEFQELLILALLYFIVKTMRNYRELGRIARSKSVSAFIRTAQRMLL